MVPTYHDIQKLTGLSLATISKYFNGGNVRAANRTAIDAAVDQLGFRVNVFARSLRTRRSRTVGILVPQFDNEFHAAILAGAEESLRSLNYGTVVCSRRSGAEEAHESVEFLESKMVDGIIAIPMPGDGPALAAAQAGGIPVVLADRVVEGIDADCVVVDNRAGGEAAVAALAAAGHERIGVLCGPQEIYTMSERLAGFQDGLARRGLPSDADLTVIGPLTVGGGIEGMRRLLGQGRPPTAVFCVNYHLTLGAVIALNELGRQIPQDVSFVGFDSLELAHAVRPSLTIVLQPVTEIARAAATLIHGRIEETLTGPTQTTMLDVEIVEGESIGEPSTIDVR